MKKVCLISLVCLILHPFISSGQYVIRQESFYGSSGCNCQGGQSFRTDSSGVITQIDFYAHQTLGVITIQIFAGESSVGTPLSIDTVNVNTTGWKNVPIKNGPFVCPGQYTFVLSNIMSIAMNANDVYSQGKMLMGSSFYFYDMVFRVYIARTPPVNPNPNNVCPGGSTSFSVVSSSNYALTYQWQLSSNGGASWNNNSNAGVYSGVTTATMYISGASAGMNTYRYRSLIGSACGNTASVVSQLNVNTAPAITSGPVADTTEPGNNASFSITASGTPPLSYQWQLSTNGGANWLNQANGGVYSGMNAATMTITGATYGISNYQYRCSVTNVCGSTNSTGAPLCVRQYIIKQENISGGWFGHFNATGGQSFTADTGGYLSQIDYYTYEAEGITVFNIFQGETVSGPLLYTDTINMTCAGWCNIPVWPKLHICTNKYTFTLSNLDHTVVHTTDDYPGGMLYYGSTFAPQWDLAFRVYIDQDPGAYTAAIISPPVNVTVCNGNNTSFSITATGSALNYQWQLSTDGGTNWANQNNGGVYNGMTIGTMNITAATAGMNTYRYRCSVSNACGSTISQDAMLTVNMPLAVTAQPSNRTICSGAGTGFSISANGTQPISYQWQLSTDGGTTWVGTPNGGVYNGMTSSSMTISGATSGMNAYKYRCSLSNFCGSTVTSDALLTVNQPISFSGTWVLNTICAGQNTAFSVIASGTQPISYQWQVSSNGGVSYVNQPNGGVYSGMTTATMTITGALAGMSFYRYHCVATNYCGSFTSPECFIQVDAPPVTVSAPANATICAGSNTQFSVTATGVNPKTYQWQLSTNGGVSWSNQPDSGVYSQMNIVTMIITGATIGMNGFQYRCHIENTCGTTNSPSALLTVNAAPSISASPVNNTICDGVGSSFSVSVTGTPPINYQWQLSTDGGTNWANQNNGGVYNGMTTATMNISAATSGMTAYQYRCYVYNSCGNTNSAAGILTVNGYPTITINSIPDPPVICRGDSVSLHASGAASYSWTPPQGLYPTLGSDVKASPDSSTVYTITGTQNGCSSVATFGITVNQLPVLSIITNPTPPAACITIPVSLTASGATTYTWQPDTGLNINSGPSVIATPISSTTYTVTGSTLGCTASSTVTVTLMNCGNVWTGNSDSLWSNPGNWSAGSIPGPGTDVTIPSGKPRQPLICGTAECAGLNIFNGALLTIMQHGTLTTHGNTVLNGNDNLRIISNSSGSGSFIDNGSISGTGKVIIGRYIPANSWHYISSPVHPARAAVFQGQYVKKWTEPAYSWQSIIIPSSLLSTMSGYAVKSSSGKEFLFRGSPNTGTFSTTLTRSPGLPASKQGWNLAGNPYPCAVDWDAAVGWSKVNVDNAVYIFSQTYNSYATYAGGIGINGGSQFIAPGQGFYVRCNSLSGGSLEINNNARLHKDTTFFKSDRLFEMVRFTLTDSVSHDETVIRIDPEATSGFDTYFDAAKLLNAEQAQLWSSTQEYPDELMSINSISDPAAEGFVTISMHCIRDGNYQLVASDFEQLVQHSGLFLEDMKTGEVTALAVNPEYRFYARSGDAMNRFRVYFSTPSSASLNKSACTPLVYPNPTSGKFKIAIPPGRIPISVIGIRNNFNTLVYTIPATNRTEYPVDAGFLPAGIYFISFDGGINEAKLIIIK